MRYEIEVSTYKRFVIFAHSEKEAVAVAEDKFNGTPARCLEFACEVLSRPPAPRCTCKDTYEVGSGARCPVHEVDA